MSEQQSVPDGEIDQPRDMTQDELDQALRWLEDLAGKQGKSLDGLITLDETNLEDSPFKGLFDSDEQELPDWLREVPSVDDLSDDPLEGESRLDWLARMASRESVEELPTLEWRRLTEDEDEDGDLVDAMPDAAAAIAGLPAVTEPITEASIVNPFPAERPIDDDESAVDSEPGVSTEPGLEVGPPAVVELMAAMAAAEAATKFADAEPDAALEEPTSLLELQDTPPGVTADLEVIENSAPEQEDVMQTAENNLVAGPDASGFGADDLDEAMAWLEELAASQDAPIEDLPSVADRALASKLIAEAASGLSPREGVDMSQLGIALSGIYVGQTKLAPTGPLIGEGPADETPDSALHAEVFLATETGSFAEDVEQQVTIDPDAEQVTAAEIVEELPTDEMIVLDTLTEEAVIEQVNTADTVIQESGTATHFTGESATEALIIHEIITDPFVTDEFAIDEPVLIEEPNMPVIATEEWAEEASLAALMTQSPKTLPEMLSAVDQLAVPSGLSLEEIDALLATDQTPVKITPFSLDSTLDWLESVANGGPAVDPLDTALVAAMPDDPDEAQAYLEQLAGDPDSQVTAVVAIPNSDATAGHDLTEADLLDMPDDPDAAIAWIENLAAQRQHTNS